MRRTHRYARPAVRIFPVSVAERPSFTAAYRLRSAWSSSPISSISKARATLSRVTRTAFVVSSFTHCHSMLDLVARELDLAYRDCNAGNGGYRAYDVEPCSFDDDGRDDEPQHDQDHARHISTLQSDALPHNCEPSRGGNQLRSCPHSSTKTKGRLRRPRARPCSCLRRPRQGATAHSGLRLLAIEVGI